MLICQAECPQGSSRGMRNEGMPATSPPTAWPAPASLAVSPGDAPAHVPDAGVAKFRFQSYAATHVVWDSFTQGIGYLVAALAILRVPVFVLGTRSVPLEFRNPPMDRCKDAPAPTALV
jgi:hypothetical protein